MPLQDVPLSSQTLAETQPLIRSNFSTIDTAFSVDHVDYVDAGQGKHNKVTFPVQSGAPVFNLGEVGLYNLLNTTTSVDELYITNSTGVSTPMTASAQSTNGWSYLPSGLLIKWGNITGNFPNGTWQQFMYPVAANIPVFNNVFNISIQAVSTDVLPAQTQTFNYITVSSTYTATYFWWIPRTNFGNVNQRSLFYYVIGN